MKTNLKYGKGEVPFAVPDKNLLGVLEPSGMEPIDDLEGKVRDLLDNPTAGPSLAELVESIGPDKVAIIVNDMTRSTPTSRLLPPMLDKLMDLGLERKQIHIVVATGTHRPMTREEIVGIIGERIYDAFDVTNHDCDSPDLVHMGTLSGGNEFMVNRIVAKADLRIAIGEVLLHYYAGFAGGRKSILPGVSGRETVMRNHRMMTRPGAGIGNIKNNPVSDQMIEAVREYCPLHFIVNCVSDSHKRVVAIVGGDFIEAWEKGIEVFRKMNFINLKQQADAVIVSAGGFPKDINMYQAHKALEMCSSAVRKGGTIVFLAELSEGYGHPVFKEWAQKGMTSDEAIERFDNDFRFGAHKVYYLAKLVKKCDILLYSTADEEMSRSMFCRKIHSVDEVLSILTHKYGSGFSAWIIPQGGIVLPVYDG